MFLFLSFFTGVAGFVVIFANNNERGGLTALETQNVIRNYEIDQSMIIIIIIVCIIACTADTFFPGNNYHYPTYPLRKLIILYK